MILLLAGAVAVALWTAQAIRAVYFHPLSRYPGPRVAVLFPSWWEWYWNYHHTGLLLFEIERLHQRHGPVVRIGVNDLHINDPLVALDITRPPCGFTKSPGLYQFISFPGTSIGETDPAAHRLRRKALTPALSGTRVSELARTLVEPKTTQLMARLRQAAAAGAVVSVPAAAKALAMDIIGKIVLGADMGCLESPDYSNPLSDHLKKAMEIGWAGPAFPTMTAVALWLESRVDLSVFPIALLQYKKHCLQITRSYMAKFGDDSGAWGASPDNGNSGQPSCGEKSRLAGERSAVIDMLMDPDAVKGHRIQSIEALNDELVTLLTAGNDTTSNSMVYGIHRICNMPNVAAKLFAELKTAFPSLEDEITYERARNLPFLTATLSEVLRLANPIPGRLPRTVPQQGYAMMGHQLRAGVNIHTSAYLLNRHPGVWDRPWEFIPERWMGNDAEVAQMHRFLASFGRGARGCLGKDLAWCELWVLFANLFRRFRVRPLDYDDAAAEKEMDWVDVVMTIYTKDLMVRLEVRDT